MITKFIWKTEVLKSSERIGVLQAKTLILGSLTNLILQVLSLTFLFSTNFNFAYANKNKLILTQDQLTSDQLNKLKREKWFENQKLVDFSELPEFLPYYHNVIELTKFLLTDKDSDKPVFIILTQSLIPDIEFHYSSVGPHYLHLSLGMLNFIENDDELASLIGTELEVEKSELLRKERFEGALYRTTHSGAVGDSKFGFLIRAAKGETSLKAVVTRLHEKKLNPAAARRVLVRLKGLSNQRILISQRDLDIRIDAVDALLLAMKRRYGRRFDNSAFTNKYVNQQVKSAFSSEVYRGQQERKLTQLVEDIEESIDELTLFFEIPIEDIDADLSKKSHIEGLSRRLTEEIDSLANLIKDLFLGLKTVDEIYVMTLSIQAKMLDKLAVVRRKVTEQGGLSLLFKVPELFNLLSNLASNDLTSDKHDYHSIPLITHLIKHYDLLKKKKTLQLRLDTDDFVTYYEHDNSSSRSVAELEMSRIDDRIDAALQEYKDFRDKWYEFDDIDEFDQRAHRAVKIRTSLQVGEKIPSEYFDLLGSFKVQEKYISRSRKEVRRFFDALGFRVENASDIQISVLSSEYKSLYEKIVKHMTRDLKLSLARNLLGRLFNELTKVIELDEDEFLKYYSSLSQYQSSKHLVKLHQLGLLLEHASSFAHELMTVLSPTDRADQNIIAEFFRYYDEFVEIVISANRKHGLRIAFEDRGNMRYAFEVESFLGKSFTPGEPIKIYLGTYFGGNHQKVNDFKGEQTKRGVREVTNYDFQFKPIILPFNGHAEEIMQIFGLGLSHLFSTVRGAEVELNAAISFDKIYSKMKFPELTRWVEKQPKAPSYLEQLYAEIFILNNFYDFQVVDRKKAVDTTTRAIKNLEKLLASGDAHFIELFSKSIKLSELFSYAYFADLSSDQITRTLNKLKPFFATYIRIGDIIYKRHADRLFGIVDTVRKINMFEIDTDLAHTISSSFQYFPSSRDAVDAGVAQSLNRAESDFESFKHREWYGKAQHQFFTNMPEGSGHDLKTYFQDQYKDLNLRFNLRSGGNDRFEYVMPRERLTKNQIAVFIIAIEENILMEHNTRAVPASEKYDFQILVEKYLNPDSYSALDGIDMNLKSDLIKVLMRSTAPTAARDLIFFGLLDDTQKRGGDIKEFLEPHWISGLFYDSYKEQIAMWQLNQLFGIDKIAKDLRQGRTPLPRKNQVRKNLQEILDFVDRQFPSRNLTKENVLSLVEEKLLTTQAETRIFMNHRANAENWSDADKAFVFNLPSEITDEIDSPEDYYETLTYLLNTHDKIPSWVDRLAEKKLYRFGRNFTSSKEELEEKQQVEKEKQITVSVLVNLKSLFSTMSTSLQTAVVSQFLNDEKGLLSDEHYKLKIFRLILGKHSDDILVKSILSAYLESAPEEQYKHLISYIVASKTQSKSHKRESLKPIFEAMGAFGIKAAQFLYSSGLLSPELSEDLEDFLSAALPPSRYTIVHFLEKAFGKELVNITHIGELKGSGSINYVVGVHFEVKGKKYKSVVRIRRPFLEGNNENENEIWERVVKWIDYFTINNNDLTLEDRDNFSEASSIINEARRQAYETLKAGGQELDLSYERERLSLARVYQRTIKSGELAGWSVEPVEHIQFLQDLVPEYLQSLFSIYPEVEHNPINGIQDEQLQKAIALEILRAELKALFDRGTFDSDGHLGNWLIDIKNKKLIRVDYAQILDLDNKGESKVREAFTTVFFALQSSKPDFSAEKTMRALFQLIKWPEGFQPSVDDFVGMTKEFAQEEMSFHKRLFELRGLINKRMTSKFGRKMDIQFTKEMRAAFSSIGKLMKLQSYIGKIDFFKEFAKYNPKTFSSKESVYLSALNMWDSVSSVVRKLFSSSGPDSLTSVIGTNDSKVDYDSPHPNVETITEVPDSDLLIEDIIPNGKSKEEVEVKYVTAVFRDHVEMQLEDYAKLKRHNDVIPIIEKIFNELPMGTVLYPAHKGMPVGEYTVGFGFGDGAPHSAHVSEYKGFMTYGISREDYDKFGGPSRREFLTVHDFENLDLRSNAVVTNKNGGEMVLLNRQQFDSLPDNTFLVDSSGDTVLKNSRTKFVEWYNGFGIHGFPSKNQKGFTEVGIDMTKIDAWQTSACLRALEEKGGQ